MWPFNRQHFWLGFWSQMRDQAPMAFGIALPMTVWAIWKLLT
jgi:hypothetical protein